MSDWVPIVITAMATILASSGFWVFITKRMERKDERTKLLIGLAHDRIVSLGLRYIQRGWITQDEYENLYEYLYKPYEALGGNGSAKRVMEEVRRLPIRTVSINSIKESNDHENS